MPDLMYFRQFDPKHDRELIIAYGQNLLGDSRAEIERLLFIIERRQLSKPFSPYKVLFIADEHDHVVGCVLYHIKHHVFFINYVGFLPSFRNQGNVSALVSPFEDFVRATGKRIIRAGVSKDNHALNLFQHWGYRITADAEQSVIIEKRLYDQ